MAHNLFLSFATEDNDLVQLFRGQIKTVRPNLTLRDYSAKKPFDSSWKTHCEHILRTCSATICLIGKDTYKSEPVDWELRKSAELGKGIMAVYLESTDVSVPKALVDLGARAVPWEMDKIMKEFDRVAG